MAKRKCIQCGHPFEPKTSIHKLCSTKCRRDFYRANPRGSGFKKKKCVECGGSFTIGVSDTLCSNECLAKHRGLDRPHDPWQRGTIPPDQLGEDLVYTPSFEAGF